jgi:hypothetical protein
MLQPVFYSDAKDPESSSSTCKVSMSSCVSHFKKCFLLKMEFMLKYKALKI